MLLVLITLVCVGDGSPQAAPAPPPSSPVTKALRDGKFPWYDAETDQVQPVWTPRMSWLRTLRKRIRSIMEAIGKFFERFKFSGPGRFAISGNMIATVVLLVLLIGFFLWLLTLWYRMEGGVVATETGRTNRGTAARLANLPEGLLPGDGDPWAEAQRRRAAGDLAGAIVSLFAHQLVALDQIGLIRLAPSKTGRHYVTGLRDRDLAQSLGATLRLFEDVYYGRRAPTREAFEPVWTRALIFQERLRALGVGALS